MTHMEQLTHTHRHTHTEHIHTHRNTHTYIHTHTETHTHTHTRTKAHTSTEAQIYLHPHTETHTNTLAHIHQHTYTHTDTHKQTHPHTPCGARLFRLTFSSHWGSESRLVYRSSTLLSISSLSLSISLAFSPSGPRMSSSGTYVSGKVSGLSCDPFTSREEDHVSSRLLSSALFRQHCCMSCFCV